METLLIVLGVTFALVFGAKVIWSFIIIVGGFFWNLSGAILAYALVVFGLMVYVGLSVPH
jgi:hypothetical protein